MDETAAPLRELIEELKRLPGIGQKSAERIAFHLLRAERERSQALAQAVLAMRDGLRLCRICQNISGAEVCGFCANPRRNRAVLCVVEQPRDVWAVEKTRQFDGLYHVLHGALSPVEGVGPEQIRLPSLLERLRETTPAGAPVVEEIIIATDPDAEGEATAAYLAQLLKPLTARVSRIGMGVPVGGELDYADEVTVSQALRSRRTL
ncbi:MAG: recombination mediator RecR [Terriglobales bacterium]